MTHDMHASVLDEASLEAARKLGREAPPLSDDVLAMLQASGFPFASALPVADVRASVPAAAPRRFPAGGAGAATLAGAS